MSIVNNNPAKSVRHPIKDDDIVWTTHIIANKDEGVEYKDKEPYR